MKSLGKLTVNGDPCLVVSSAGSCLHMEGDDGDSIKYVGIYLPTSIFYGKFRCLPRRLRDKAADTIICESTPQSTSSLSLPLTVILFPPLQEISDRSEELVFVSPSPNPPPVSHFHCHPLPTSSDEICGSIPQSTSSLSPPLTVILFPPLQFSLTSAECHPLSTSPGRSASRAQSSSSLSLLLTVILFPPLQEYEEFSHPSTDCHPLPTLQRDMDANYVPMQVD
ncbi:hypothetical protein BT96DRAFT_948068 [Gymnopus androsaceus JB14]|uniref:Uncharacterized protein n=1 Tax=Gymnopus androsaceus JB14 TaxID=1447944 RepID=A0A6A4GQ44_9AGAR|nr:hypothetical protein BT96DRAFT_948068 [Gymnopus androsaceus JB14]